jgi:glycosyltransferase involved in cell wall biosynthesis
MHDTGPWIVAEAITAGCPVVTLNIGGPTLLVGKTDGVLIETDSADIVGDLARGLDRARELRPDRSRWLATRLPDFCSAIYTQAATAPKPSSSGVTMPVDKADCDAGR